jgi:hypothetical protein
MNVLPKPYTAWATSLAGTRRREARQQGRVRRADLSRRRPALTSVLGVACKRFASGHPPRDNDPLCSGREAIRACATAAAAASQMDRQRRGAKLRRSAGGARA